ncbi:hypothetical protein WA026_020371 [Henosepilachna vigintioctopunctata]|uniref:C2 domain-containing protein n=1 Tax=Henosepilachna vigintioctopunctata TaxID=420089 RepID=A0AAW1UIC4_9CUCU
MLLGYENVQSTDVHYRSLTGEGNFNWRFIFPMEYLPNEDKIVTYPDGGKTTPQQNGTKFPCRLTIQVWENDTLSKDDFLGTLTLDLAHMPRGAKSPEQCTLAIIDPYVPHINIFKVRRTKGWWPFKGYDLDGNFTLVGKVEMEFEMLPSEEAQKTPAGLGRTAPQPLPEPKRPDTSFSWLLNPLKALKHVVCKLHRWKCICCCCWLLLFIFVGLAIYAFPGYFVKKILHV